MTGPDVRRAAIPTSRADDGGERRIGVVLAIGHDRLRRSLARLIDSEDDMCVADAVASWSAAIAAATLAKPDVIVFNVRAEQASLLATVVALREQLPGVGVVVLTMDASVAVADRVIDAGAAGLVLTERADAELPAAIRAAAAQGHEFVSASLRPRLELLRFRAS